MEAESKEMGYNHQTTKMNRKWLYQFGKYRAMEIRAPWLGQSFEYSKGNLYLGLKDEACQWNNACFGIIFLGIYDTRVIIVNRPKDFSAPVIIQGQEFHQSMSTVREGVIGIIYSKITRN